MSDHCFNSGNIARKIVFLCTLFAFAPPSFCSQPPPIRFNHLTVETGLSNNNVDERGQSILQDRNGFMWFGTQNGLNRYDGYNIKTYEHAPENPRSISDNFISTLYEDSQGALWVGTSVALDRFDPDTESFTRVASKGPNLGTIRDVVEDKPGILWIGSSRGLHYFDTKSGTSVYYGHDDSDPHSLLSHDVNTLLNDSQGVLWVGTAKGLNRFDPLTKQFVRYESEPHSSSSNAIEKLFEDRQGNLWVGTNQGLYHLDKTRQTLRPYLLATDESSNLSNVGISSIIEDRQSQLWLGLHTNGLIHLNPETGQLDHYRYNAATPRGLCGNSVASLYIDRQNKLWAGTLGNGICHFSLDSFQFGHHKHIAADGTSPIPVLSLLEDKNQALWVGTFGGGLARYNPVTEQVTHYFYDENNPQSLSDNRVMSLYEDNRGTLWVGTFNGLNRFDPGSGSFIRYENGPILITAITEDEQGQIWAGSGRNGLYTLDSARAQLASFNNGEIYWGVGGFYPGKNGTLWIASSRGLVQLTPGKATILHHHDANNPNSLSHDFVMCVYEDKHGILWIGTLGGGLNRFDPQSGLFRHYVKSDGLPSNTIYGILADNKNNLWISTDWGISKYNSATEMFTNYSVEDGLQDYDFNQGAYTKTRSGELLFGGLKGFNRFFPDNISHTAAAISPIRFTDFRLFNKSVPVGREGQTESYRLNKAIYTLDALQLTHKESFFTFEFAAINVLKPNSVRYAYQLQGWDDEWIYTDHTNRLATYTNISAGDYVLKVKAIDKDGVWGEVSTAIKLTILPPWWKSTWAYLLYALLAVIAVFLTIWLRTHALQQRAKMLEETVLQRTREIATRTDEIAAQKQTIEALLSKKEELFANVSHEFRTPLTLITGPITQILKESRSKKIKEALAPTLFNAKRLLRMVDQLLDLARLDSSAIESNVSVNISTALEKIHAGMHSLLQERELSTSIDIEPGLHVNANLDAIEKIIVNLLSNAIKYTPRGGHIEVCVKSSEDVVLLSIKDNGIGIALEERKKIFDRFVRLNVQTEDSSPGAGIGLALVKQLVQCFNGRISVQSALGEGATFTVSLPRVNANSADDQKPHISASHIIEQEVEALKAAHFKSAPFSSGENVTPEEKPKALIVEDHPDMLHFIQQVLASRYQCFLAEDGLSGIKTALEEVPDLIITDLMMPNKSGFELANVVRNDTRTSHIPIIMLTANADEQSRMQAWKSDIDDYVEKPFDAEELLLRCENLISIRRILSQRLGAELNHTASKDFPTLNNRDRAFIEKLKELVATHYTDSQLNATMISRELAMSESQLQRKIKALLGQSVPDYIRTFRLQKGAELLQQGGLVTEVAYQVGFSSPNYFSSCFKAHYGLTPKNYQAH